MAGKSPKRRKSSRGLAPGSEVAQSTVRMTSQYTDELKYLFYVDDIACPVPKGEFTMMLEACYTRRTTHTGYLKLEACVAAKKNPNYFAKLASELRKAMPHRELLGSGGNCDWLKCAPDKITICPGVLELTEIDSRVRDKVLSLLNNASKDTGNAANG